MGPREKSGLFGNGKFIRRRPLMPTTHRPQASDHHDLPTFVERRAAFVQGENEKAVLKAHSSQIYADVWLNSTTTAQLWATASGRTTTAPSSSSLSAFWWTSYYSSTWQLYSSISCLQHSCLLCLVRASGHTCLPTLMHSGQLSG